MSNDTRRTYRKHTKGPCAVLSSGRSGTDANMDYCCYSDAGPDQADVDDPWAVSDQADVDDDALVVSDQVDVDDLRDGFRRPGHFQLINHVCASRLSPRPCQSHFPLTEEGSLGMIVLQHLHVFEMLCVVNFRLEIM